MARTHTPHRSRAGRHAADLAKPGAYLELQGAKVEMVGSAMRLAVGVGGGVRTAADADFEPNVSAGSKGLATKDWGGRGGGRRRNGRRGRVLRRGR